MLSRNLLTFALLLLTVSQALAAERLAPFNNPPKSVRSRDVDQQHISVELDLDWESQTIDGRVMHRLLPLRELRELQLDAAEMTISDVMLVGDQGDEESKLQSLKFHHRGQSLTIEFDEPISAGREILLAVAYKVTKPRRGGHFVLPDENEPTQPRMFWTQSEPEYARYWFPCHDSPTDRVTSDIRITVPADYFVLSNGTLASKTEPENGRRMWHWVQRKTHVPYLFSVVAGDFEEYEQEWDGIPIVSYVPRGHFDQAARSFEKTAAMMEYFSEKIGYRYPWAKYTQICVDEYAWGGMEHTSATTLTLRTLHDERAHLDVQSDGLVAHELAHQWWGDMLTCKDWAEIWLNESFATYFTTLWIEHDLGWDEATWERHKEEVSYKNEDKNRYRRPIVTYRYPSPDSMFDRHSYPKGGRVLHMLRFVLGDASFWRAMRFYAHANEFDVVDTDDLKDAVFHATGQGLNWFFDQWVYHGGHPEYKVRYEYDSREQTLRMTVEQTQQVTDTTPLFRMPVEIEIVTPSETIVRKVSVAAKKETFNFDVPERPSRVLFDPRDWVLKELDFEKSKQEWLDQLKNDKNIMCRVRAVDALAKLKPDAQAKAALLHAVQNDAFWSVRQQAAEALKEFAGDDVRHALQQVAAQDQKSDVRRAAVVALRDHPDDSTKQVIRSVVAQDPSYYVIADALRTLVAIDEEGCRDDLYTALSSESHREVILGAAADGLAKIKDPDAVDRLLEIFEPPSSPYRRAAIVKALAKLGRDDERVVELLTDQLKSERQWVRVAAVNALSETGDPTLVPLLLNQKSAETSRRATQAIDDAVRQLRESDTDERKLRSRIEQLEKQQNELQRKLGSLQEEKS